MTEKSEGASELTTQNEQASDVAERVVSVVSPLLRHKSQTPRVRQLVKQEVSEHYQGPLPHPDHLRRFEELVPGAADRIIHMAEREQQHRHLIDQRQINYPYWGLASGLAIALLAIGGSICLGAVGEISVAIPLIGVPVLGCIGWFVNARVSLGQAEPPPAPAHNAKRRRSGETEPPVPALKRLVKPRLKRLGFNQ